MSQSKRKHFIGGVIGGTIGGICWMIIAGIAIKSSLLIVLPIVWGLICIVGEVKLYNDYPERKFAIMGLGIFWLLILAFIVVNNIYDKIPETLWRITTGKNQLSLLKLNIFLGCFSLWGFYWIIKDIIQKK